MSLISFKARANVVDCDIGGDRALLHLDSNRYFTMNPTASAIWMALSSEKTLDQLVSHVTEQFDVSEETCRQDVLELVDQMVVADLLETAASTEDA